MTNNCVLGQVYVWALRHFPRGFHTSVKPLTPKPEGYEIEFCRKVLSAGENE